MAFLDWLSRWLAHHPIKSPSVSDRAEFTAGVMARVRAAAKPGNARAASALRLGLPWSRLAVSAALAAAAVAAVGVLQPLRPGSPSAALLQEADMLAELDESAAADLSVDDVESLAEELEHQDAVILAEAPEDDAAWLTQTLQMLDQLDQELPEDATSAPGEEEEWLQELQSLDESELAAPS
jgi:hypothetical protein